MTKRFDVLFEPVETCIEAIGGPTGGECVQTVGVPPVLFRETGLQLRQARRLAGLERA